MITILLTVAVDFRLKEAAVMLRLNPDLGLATACSGDRQSDIFGINIGDKVPHVSCFKLEHLLVIDKINAVRAVLKERL